MKINLYFKQTKKNTKDKCYEINEELTSFNSNSDEKGEETKDN